MKDSISPRLFPITWALFFSTLLVISALVYLAENFTGVEAETVEETAVTIDRKVINTPVERKTINTTPQIEENLTIEEIQVEETWVEETRVEETQPTPTIFITQTNPAYGINRISNSEQPNVPEAQYQNGISSGATWDRWPIYWSNIEFPTPGEFHWDYQDTAVKAVITHGLKLNIILLGTPEFYHTPPAADQPIQPTPDTPAHSPMVLNETQTGVPLGLYETVFTDGDEPGAGKTINPNNVWARFVETAVNRYKPGGLIAQAEEWPTDFGVTHWEMWNEPDLPHFWDGTWDDYARLLKVGYLAAKHADPNAQVILGGLALIHDNDIPLLSYVFDKYDNDPMAASNNYFHDIVAVHNYSYAKRSWNAIYVARRRLYDRQLNNEIWLNESGVPVWDDYPGPVCDPTSSFRATMQEQADFIIQSALYARVNRVDNIFFFSLYDECGNVGGNPSYFPPDQCASNPPPANYAGDAFGLFRNQNDSLSLCATDHPQPSTPRPGFAAYQVLTKYFVNVNWFKRDIFGEFGSGDNGLHEVIAFYQPHTKSRVLGLWAITNESATAVFTPTHSSQTGLLISPDGVTQTITATNGVFSLPLPGATNNNTPTGSLFHAIGGRPFLFIEQDDIPPNISISAPHSAITEVTVQWQGSDLGSSIENFDITVSENSGLAIPWLTATTAVSATYTSLNEGSIYTFTAYGRDQAGNVSSGTSTNVIIPILDKHIYLPAIQKP